jgi:hypothetical protein
VARGSGHRAAGCHNRRSRRAKLTLHGPWDDSQVSAWLQAQASQLGGINDPGAVSVDDEVQGLGMMLGGRHDQILPAHSAYMPCVKLPPISTSRWTRPRRSCGSAGRRAERVGARLLRSRGGRRGVAGRLRRSPRLPRVAVAQGEEGSRWSDVAAIPGESGVPLSGAGESMARSC